jgi:hypothetical protein
MPWYVLFSNYTGRAIHAFLQSNHTLRYMQTHVLSPHTCLKRDDFVSYTFSKHRSTTDERFADSHTRVFGKERAVLCAPPLPRQKYHIFVLFYLFCFVLFRFSDLILIISGQSYMRYLSYSPSIITSFTAARWSSKIENPFYRKNKKDTTAWLNKVWTQIHQT